MTFWSMSEVESRRVLWIFEYLVIYIECVESWKNNRSLLMFRKILTKKWSILGHYIQRILFPVILISMDFEISFMKYLTY